MDGKFCVECGAKLDLTAKFCRVCGRSQPEIQFPAGLEKPVTEPAAEPEAPAEQAIAAENTETKAERFFKDTESEAAPTDTAAPEPETVPPPVQQPAPEAVDDVPAPEESGGMKAPYILLIAAALVIVAMFVWAVFAMNKLDMTHQKKSSSSSRSISLAKPDDPSSKSSSEYSGVGGRSSSPDNESSGGYSGVGGKAEKVYKAGDYTAGKNIPAGDYIIIADTNDSIMDDEPDYLPTFYAGVYNDPQEKDKVYAGWFQHSAYVRVEDGQDLHFSWASAYPVSSYSGKNDPFERPGVFLVGRDVEPGTYKLEPLTDQGYESYAVYEDMTAMMSDEELEQDFSFDKNEKITLKKGQYVKLEWCKLKK
jgi:hypothetical protein